ncbi:MAG: UDP-N-acetylmuramate--L-alanine ligase [Anaerolineales bacterium]|nr:UDP-N-acetylmuramate--L-alanine ligase [Anaerolineales bacterium]
MHIHLIGIGGSGLSAIALVLLESGYAVSGSDRQASPLSRKLQQAGVTVYYGHQAENIAGADLVVRSSAVPDENVEVKAAREAGIPVLKRADFLGQLMAGKQAIAVAGTHGKTTTTAMIAWMLKVLELDPSYVIGGVSVDLGGNAHAGSGQYFVIEADEYDRMFLGLQPDLAVVTNIEHDHPDCYPTYQDFYLAFQEFVTRLKPGGALVACGDNPGSAQLLSWAVEQGFRAFSYGLQSTSYDYSTTRTVYGEQGDFSFSALHGGKIMAEVPLQVPGNHNVSNALAALAVAHVLGLPMDRAAAALGQFRGTGRRFELRGEAAGILVFDDYAHHPTKIRATLSAARARFPQRRIWAVWQPHTYSRARTLFADFAAAFGDADQILVTEVYAAREAAPEDGFSAYPFIQAIQAHATAPDCVHYAPTLVEARDYLLEHIRPGDVVFVLSAGDADQISAQVLQTLRNDLASATEGRSGMALN